VDQDHANVQRAQDCDIEEDIGEVLAGYDSPIHAQDERLFTELRDVLKDAPEVGQFHFGSNLFCNAGQQVRLSENFSKRFFLMLLSLLSLTPCLSKVH